MTKQKRKLTFEIFNDTNEIRLLNDEGDSIFLTAMEWKRILDVYENVPITGNVHRLTITFNRDSEIKEEE